MEKRKIHSFLFVIAALILTLTVAFGLTACGETDDESPGGGSYICVPKTEVIR